MALFLVPCSDILEKETYQSHNHAKEVEHQGDNDHSNERDMCSPFCLCNCCGMISNIVLQWEFYTLIKDNTVDLSKPKLNYKSIFIPLYIGDIWQPPKINA